MTRISISIYVYMFICHVCEVCAIAVLVSVTNRPQTEHVCRRVRMRTRAKRLSVHVSFPDIEISDFDAWKTLHNNSENSYISEINIYAPLHVVDSNAILDSANWSDHSATSDCSECRNFSANVSI